MVLHFRVVQEADLDEIIRFELDKLKETMPDPIERELYSWKARWRKESMQHYLPLGWSFLIRDSDEKSEEFPEGRLLGYFLAQTFLFVEGMTQSLWVEHISFNALKVRDELCELAFKLAREKHFQQVFFPNLSGLINGVQQFKPEVWSPSILILKTTKVGQT